jgi:hypothetical protein
MTVAGKLFAESFLEKSMLPQSSFNESSHDRFFREVQRPFQWWVWILVVVSVALLAWLFFLHQIVGGEPLGTYPAPDWVVMLFWVLFGLTLPLLFLTSHLTTEVRAEGLHVAYFPFFRKQIAYADLVRCIAVTYKPLSHFGGWGIRVNLDGSWAWSVSGNRGVQLVFRNGSRLLIGSQLAQEFADALNAVREKNS